ncbi:ThiF family domain containing protein, putative [Babesia bigemina]|uniref:NEDD8-activating enzyme E1 catalytic subunit n=1 Tax=Babesia bigemina TaxID=5866 RepID=A0A061D7X9_BABBI|nr:ThiF family domain containing protein, putative [Babesia bigemina]CDR96107.1 ThiF family domain containing protein, putative [Babesia bigemina]|eukprot:XP_012768293.1 ThiF family domain containing protein, putative [Babesia bigemina]
MEDAPISNVMLIGAGGLGCEIIKNLAILGVRNITIVDPDTVELHNLTRQFLYRRNNVGMYKAQVAAQRITEHSKHITANYINQAIQNVPLTTIAKSDVIISAVDNVEARRWINLATMVIWQKRGNNVNFDSQRVGNPLPILIDGGSQELYGHVRVVSGRDQPCLECSLPLFSDEAYQPSCSIPKEPKSPEDCVRYVISHMFEDFTNERAEVKLPSNTKPISTVQGMRHAEIVDRVYEEARKYANAYGIETVTMAMVRKILNRGAINVNTTNAIIAAVIAHVAVNRDATKNFYFYSGDGNSVLDGFTMQKQEDCTLCKCKVITLQTDCQQTLKQLIDQIECITHSKNINITTKKGAVYLGSSSHLRELYNIRLHQTLDELKDILDENMYVTTPAGEAWYYVHMQQCHNLCCKNP